MSAQPNHFAPLARLLHLAAAMFHGWVRRDDVLNSMLRGKDRG